MERMIWMLHGAVGMADDWDVVGDLPDSHAVDLWSYLEDGGISLQDFADRFCGEVQSADAEPVLLGYSMGGRLALHCLLARPDLWKAAVIVSAHPGLESGGERLERMADDAEWAGKALTSEWSAFLEAWEQQSLFRESETVGRMGDRSHLEPRRGAVARSFMEWSLGKQDDLRRRLKAVSCPVLWITGSRDSKFTTLGAGTAGLLRNGRHAVLEGAGHRAPWENPQGFQRMVGDFLAEAG